MSMIKKECVFKLKNGVKFFGSVTGDNKVLVNINEPVVKEHDDGTFTSHNFIEVIEDEYNDIFPSQYDALMVFNTNQTHVVIIKNVWMGITRNASLINVSDNTYDNICRVDVKYDYYQVIERSKDIYEEFNFNEEHDFLPF